MALTLTDGDRQLIEALKEANVLQNIDPTKIELSDGAIVVTCSDCDQAPDINRHLHDLAVRYRDGERFHTFRLNGGPILIPDGSPASRYGEDKVLVEHIRDGVSMKGLKRVILEAHAPCGMAKAVDQDLTQVIDLMLNGKTKLKEQIPEIETVFCMLHIDFGNKKRSYNITRHDWTNWKEAQKINLTLQ
ncbi:MAG: hypothetical protein O2877_02955 [bacterium]|nr:hypothetical protein [bacterium]